jgi:mannose-6-phosphate isomerase
MSAIGEPLLLVPEFDPKPWGGRRLAQYGKDLPDGAIGESLESGGAARISGGRFGGSTLAELVRAHSAALLGKLGSAASGEFGDFPLLIKLIDASEDLSIQVHPDDDDAPPGKRGKTEAWLILNAAPGASLITGLAGPLDPTDIASQLIRRTVSPGDVFFVPAGTVHAIGGGVLLYEVQQASDVTYRLYDWGRPRETHLADAERVLRSGGEARQVQPLRIDDRREMLVACRYFALERMSLAGAASLSASPDSFRVLTLLGDGFAIDDRQFPHGATLILPADLSTITVQGAGELLIAYVPDVQRDVIAPLIAAGHAREAIAALGLDGV